MKALRFMGYNRNHQTAETELMQEQYSTQTTEHRAYIEQTKNKEEVQLLEMAIHVHVICM